MGRRRGVQPVIGVAAVFQHPQGHRPGARLVCQREKDLAGPKTLDHSLAEGHGQSKG